MASNNQRLCKDHGGLLDLPQEILCMILEACLISHIPIDNPMGTGRECSCNKHSERWRDNDCACQRRTARDWRAKRTIRDIQGHTDDPKEGKRPRSIRSQILRTNKLVHQLGTKILYADNTFLFTNEPAFVSFVTRFPGALPRIRHIILTVRIMKYSLMLSCIEARMADVQEYPHGPWFGFAASVSDWVLLRNESGSSARRRRPLSSILVLDSLILHFLDWQQQEVIDINGTPYVKAVPYINSQGERVTDNPAEEDLRLVHQVSCPLRFTQPVDAVKLLSGFLSMGWRAKDIRLSGSGEFHQAQEYPAMRELADYGEQKYTARRELANVTATMTVGQST